MMTNERRAFGRPIILTIVTTLCIFCSAGEFLCNRRYLQRHAKTTARILIDYIYNLSYTSTYTRKGIVYWCGI